MIFFRLILATVVGGLLLPTPSAVAQAPKAPQPPTAVRPGDDTKEGVRLSFQTGDLHLILLKYEELTSKKIIRDNAIEGGKVVIDTTGRMSKEQAIEFIEKSLLFNGYAFVPSGPNMVKIVAFESGKHPRNDGVRYVPEATDLPETDEIVTHLMQLSYLEPEEAVKALQQIAPGHPYGSITPLANARSLIITENSVTIRTYLELIGQIDVRPGATEQKTFHLVRADAEEVTKAVKELLGLENAGGTAGGTPPRPATATPAVRNVANPNTPAAQQARTPDASSTGETVGSAPPPRLQAIKRTNSIIAVAQPIDMLQIEALIQELDAAGTTQNYASLPLKYVSVLGVLPVVRDALLAGGADSGGSEGGSGSSLGSGGNTGALRPQLSGGSSLDSGGFGNRNSSGFGNSGGLNSGSGLGGASGGFGSSFGGSASSSQANQAPQSLIVGKTLIIADPVSNELFVSGPPDHIETVRELTLQLDKKPRQVIISAVIGQLTLGDGVDFGVDWLHTLESIRINQHEGAAAGSLRFRNNNSSPGIPEIATLSTFANVATNAASGMTLYGLLGDQLNLFVSALESTDRFKVIQNPTVFTLNNVPATISSGQRIAVPSSTLTTVVPGQTANNSAVSATVQYEEVVLAIEVVPLINSDEELTLTIKQKNEDIVGFTTIGGNPVPNIGQQELQTTVVVPNRSSVLLGGLITERDRKNNASLPILSRIPILRHAAGTTTKEMDRNELLIFIKPTIVDAPDEVEMTQAEIESRTALAASASAFPPPPSQEARDFAGPPDPNKVPFWKKIFRRKIREPAPAPPLVAQPIPIGPVVEPAAVSP